MERSYRLLLKLVRQALPEATLRDARLRLIGLWSALFGYASVRAHGALKSYMLAVLSDAAMRQAAIDAALGARPGRPHPAG